MDYIDGFIDAFPPYYDEEESQNEAAAAHQMSLDILYHMGCQYGIKDTDMKQLCRIALIDFSELQNHSTNSTESTTPCQSQSSFLVHQAQANQPVCAT